MKLSCLQENLAKALNITSRAVAPKSSLPVLMNVLLATDNGRLRVSATNLEMRIDVLIGAKIETEGKITLPAKTIGEFVALLPRDRIDLSLNWATSTVSAACGKTRTNIKGINADEFPVGSDLPDATPMLIPAAELRKMIKLTTFAASSEASRPMLTGVFIKAEDDEIAFYATDGFRLSVAKGRLAAPISDPIQCLVPASALNEVGRVIGDQIEPVAIFAMPHKVIFHADNIDISSSLIDQKFPEVVNLIPSKFGTSATVNTSELMKSCRQAAIFARNASDVIRILVAPDQSSLAVSSKADESGDSTTEMESIAEGEPVEIGLNGQFLIESLGVIPSDTVKIQLGSPKAPVLITIPSDAAYKHVIMPINLPK